MTPAEYTPRTSRVLVLGASGFLGSNISLMAQPCVETLVLHSSTTPVRLAGAESVIADLTAPGAARALIDRTAPDVVVNCAALANVDDCDRMPEVADRMNGGLPTELAQACAEHQSQLVHFSTDAVFGTTAQPCDTSAVPGPLNHYGRSKLAGEHGVMSAMPAALIVRTNIIGWSPTGSRSLLEFFWSRLRAGTPVPGFDDVSFRPISAGDIWGLVSAWLASGAAGLRHATGAELMSKYDFGVRVARCFGLDERLVVRASVANANLGAERAPVLDVVPSAVPEGAEPDLLELDAALARLRNAEATGYRDRLANMVTNERNL